MLAIWSWEGMTWRSQCTLLVEQVAQTFRALSAFLFDLETRFAAYPFDLGSDLQRAMYAGSGLKGDLKLRWSNLVRLRHQQDLAGITWAAMRQWLLDQVADEPAWKRHNDYTVSGKQNDRRGAMHPPGADQSGEQGRDPRPFVDKQPDQRYDGDPPSDLRASKVR